jgi:hypothetical protein
MRPAEDPEKDPVSELQQNRPLWLVWQHCGCSRGKRLTGRVERHCVKMAVHVTLQFYQPAAALQKQTCLLCSRQRTVGPLLQCRVIAGPTCVPTAWELGPPRARISNCALT